MAGAISHVVYAEKALATFLSTSNKDLFLIGTLFPDIRTPAKLERKKTHPLNLYLDDVRAEQDPFTAGLLFHSVIDEARENFVIKQKVYDLIPEIYSSHIALKVCEDRYLYSKISSWEALAQLNDTIYEPELRFGVLRPIIVQWHEMHRKLFRESITEVGSPLMQLGFESDFISDIEAMIQQIEQLGIVPGYIERFYEELEHWMIVPRPIVDW